MENFRQLTDEEFEALSPSERRKYLKEKKNYDNQKMIEDIRNQSNDSDDEKYQAPIVTGMTTKNVEDIDVNLIDIGDMNEQLFGYEDINKIEQSFDTIGNNSVIYVYKRNNGRYICYAGNQRLIVSQNKGEKKITCVITGPEPDEETMLENLMFMNSQRTPRAYYTAKQIAEYEKILRRKGNNNVSEAIEEKFGIKASSQRRYKQILKLNPVLQELFKRADIPFDYLIQVCNKISDDKAERFAELFNEKCKDESPSVEIINGTLKEMESGDEPKEVVKKKVKTSQIFKDVMSLPYYAPGEQIEIPEKKKKEISEQLDQLDEYIKRLRAACL